ncbi:MAG: transcription termination/antitermination protein NusG [Dehalococcoidia bacterium]|nr:transcription termination/antitermination protein NusG [Dehalococcoidia bacterium]MDZ4246501.1 transcription termination/antitermination protein NusG [Dehalococcoidia bacterium]
MNTTTANKKKWFVVHCYSGLEDKVKRNLEQRIKSMDAGDEITRIIIPTEEEIEIHEGQRRKVMKKIFPGYLLIEMDMNDGSWNVVRNTPGVTGFVGTGNKPVALQDDEVAKILKQMEAEAPRVKVGFNTGQAVRIVDGPFIDFAGVVDEVSMEKGKVKVLVSFFGRDTSVELDLLQVERL